jgi:two-component sensor histidine kinase
MVRILLLTIILVTVFSWNKAQGQKSFLSDYAIEQLKNVPEEKQDSFYLVQGKYYYAFYTRESYRKSMECYLEALRLAIQYQHPKVILKCYFGIGSIYDANNNLAQAIHYYKLHYDGVLKERPFNAKNILRASFNIAATYAKAKDTANAYHFTLKMAEMLGWLKDQETHDQYCLLIAHNFIDIGKQGEFLEYFHKISPQTKFEDGELAFGRLYAESKSRYAFFTGSPKDSVIAPLIFELKRTRDSIPLMNLLLSSYAAIGDYKNAYECQKLLIDADMRSMDKNTYGDINYRLLEADNLLREKKNSELQVTAQQLRLKTSLLYTATFLLALGLVITLYMYRRYRIKNKLNDQHTNMTKQHEEANHLLLRKLHSGVNENLGTLTQSLDDLFRMSGQTPAELNREIKAGLNCIAFAHDILGRNDEINKVDLLPYFQTLTQRTFELFEVEGVDICWTFDILTDRMEVTKLIPLALAVVELLKNSIKNTIAISKQAEISIQCRLSDEEYHFVYKENAQLYSDADANVDTKMDTKLLYNFLKQIDAKVLNDEEQMGKHEVLIVFSK